MAKVSASVKDKALTWAMETEDIMAFNLAAATCMLH